MTAADGQPNAHVRLPGLPARIIVETLAAEYDRYADYWQALVEPGLSAHMADVYRDTAAAWRGAATLARQHLHTGPRPAVPTRGGVCGICGTLIDSLDTDHEYDQETAHGRRYVASTVTVQPCRHTWHGELPEHDRPATVAGTHPEERTPR